MSTCTERLPGIVLDPAGAYELWQDSSCLGPKRPTKSAEDFGDKETIGLHVKVRQYHGPDPLGGEWDFGLFLGVLPAHGYKWVVAIKTCSFPVRLVGYAEYDELWQLKQDWMLD